MSLHGCCPKGSGFYKGRLCSRTRTTAMLRQAKLKVVMTIVPHDGEHSAGCFTPSASALATGLRLEH